ncbi:hypothetical protein [Comamonas testosteroni]|uniref:hypothetical protein n=1 Tax=Comamonas testosteroni TaxID=285 RepID=UPI00391C21D4
MKIADPRIRRVWAMAIGGFPAAVAEKERLHARYPELDAQFEEFKTVLKRSRGTKKKKKKSVHKSSPTVWTKAREKFLTSTTGNAIPVQGGATGLKR